MAARAAFPTSWPAWAAKAARDSPPVRVAASTAVPLLGSPNPRRRDVGRAFSFFVSARAVPSMESGRLPFMRGLTHAGLSLVSSFLAMSCAAQRPPISPEAVERVETLPRDYRSLGDVHADCEEREGFTRMHGEPLSSFDCNEERLRRVLAELAVERGGDVLAEERCDRSGSRGLSLGCRARVGQRPDEERRTRPPAELAAADGFSSPAPSAAEVRRADEPLARAALAIEVDFEPKVTGFARERRSTDRVSWVASVPLSHVELGVVRTRCDADECALADLRHALRVAAGGLGASDVVGARCATLDEQSWCVAELAAAELDLARTSLP